MQVKRLLKPETFVLVNNFFNEYGKRVTMAEYSAVKHTQK